MKKLALLYLIGLSTTIVAWSYGFLRFNVFMISVLGILSVVQVFRISSLLNYPAVITFYCMTAMFPLLHYETYRISTVLFTGIFCCSYIFFLDMLHNKVITKDIFKLFLKYLVFAYFIVLVMQQIGVLTGTWIINKGTFSEFSISKLNSLSLEPAHATKILFLAINSYIVIKYIEQEKPYTLLSLMKEEPYYFIAYSYCMLTMGSVTGILMYALSLIAQRKFSIRQFVLCLILMLGAAYVIAYGNFPILERIRLFFNALFTLDPEILRSTDASAAARLAPFMIFLENLNIFSTEFWFGEGIDQCQIINRLFFHYDLDSKSGMGGMLPNYLIDFGFIPFVCFMVMIYKYCIRTKSIDMLFWDYVVFIIIAIPQGINTAILWFCIVTLSANRFFLESLNQKECSPQPCKNTETVMKADSSSPLDPQTIFLH